MRMNAFERTRNAPQAIIYVNRLNELYQDNKLYLRNRKKASNLW